MSPDKCDRNVTYVSEESKCSIEFQKGVFINQILKFCRNRRKRVIFYSVWMKQGSFPVTSTNFAYNLQIYFMHSLIAKDDSICIKGTKSCNIAQTSQRRIIDVLIL